MCVELHLDQRGPEKFEERAISLREVALSALEIDLSRASVRSGQPHPETVVDAKWLPDLVVEGKAVHLSPAEEVRQLQRPTLTSPQPVA
jgi:hypothetical protein